MDLKIASVSLSARAFDFRDNFKKEDFTSGFG
jgi:hypothetical protein